MKVGNGKVPNWYLTHELKEAARQLFVADPSKLTVDGIELTWPVVLSEEDDD